MTPPTVQNDTTRPSADPLTFPDLETFPRHKDEPRHRKADPDSLGFEHDGSRIEEKMPQPVPSNPCKEDKKEPNYIKRMLLTVLFLFAIAAAMTYGKSQSDPYSPSSNDKALTHDEWVAKGCWTYRAQCSRFDEIGSQECQWASPYTTPFAIHGKVFKPYPTCAAPK